MAFSGMAALKADMNALLRALPSPLSTSGRVYSIEQALFLGIMRHPSALTQSQGIPAFIDANGIASLRVIVSIERSLSSGLTGANPKPQLPITIEVTPCQLDILQYGSQKS
jgi:hypothetical protein